MRSLYEEQIRDGGRGLFMQVGALLSVRVLCVICGRQRTKRSSKPTVCSDDPLLFMNNDVFHVKWPGERSIGMQAFT